MSKQADKAGWTGETARAETWAEFDALPRGVKRLFWFAPYNYTARPAFDCWQRGGDLRASVARQIDAMERDVARESARLYGEAQIGWLA